MKLTASGPLHPQPSEELDYSELHSSNSKYVSVFSICLMTFISRNGPCGQNAARPMISQLAEVLGFPVRNRFGEFREKFVVPVHCMSLRFPLHWTKKYWARRAKSLAFLCCPNVKMRRGAPCIGEMKETRPCSSLV